MPIAHGICVQEYNIAVIFQKVYFLLPFYSQIVDKKKQARSGNLAT